MSEGCDIECLDPNSSRDCNEEVKNAQNLHFLLKSDGLEGISR